MNRISIKPRRHWEDVVSSQGLTFHTLDNGQPYWDESACYRFSAKEVDVIEAATNDLQAMCLQAGQYIIDNRLYGKFHIPSAAIPLIEKTWEQEPPSIYGRFDLAYDGKSPPKLLEYNADTPTSLVEASVIQWYWSEEVTKQDQFNSIHEKLIAQWKDIKTWLHADSLYLTGYGTPEDVMTVAYMEEVAQQAGMATKRIGLHDIGWNAEWRQVRDQSENEIRAIFALYPWEWLLKDCPEAVTRGKTIWIEPAWKMLWSNKALLAVLWEMFPDHPNLLEARLDSPGKMQNFARKPLFSREGANVSLHADGKVIESGGNYGEEGFVFQSIAPIPDFDGKRPVIGSWVVTDHDACGMGIRESDGPITDNFSRFVPHYF